MAIYNNLDVSLTFLFPAEKHDFGFGVGVRSVSNMVQIELHSACVANADQLLKTKSKHCFAL